MSHGQKFHTVLLTLTCSAVFLVLGKTIFYPVIKPQVAPFSFPATIPLSGWQFVVSQPLVKSGSDRADFHSGKHYRYIQAGLPLEIKVRYLVDTDGDVKAMIKREQTSSTSLTQPALVLRQRSGVGFYSLFTAQGRAYLNACINSSGNSTVTGIQFKRDRNAHDLTFQRVLNWLVGQAELQDDRCLWSQLSVPFQGTEPERAYQTLENAWFTWHQWWQPRFPRE